MDSYDHIQRNVELFLTEVFLKISKSNPYRTMVIPDDCWRVETPANRM